jgi:FAD synthetase
MKETGKTVMVFGVFDIIHDGHRHFLNEAKKLGQEIVAVLPQDAVVNEMKGRFPLHSLTERIHNLEAESIVDKVISGDNIIRSWNIINMERPDVIALGYDQVTLKNALESERTKFPWNLELVTISPYRDTSLHSNTLREKL